MVPILQTIIIFGFTLCRIFGLSSGSDINLKGFLFGFGSSDHFGRHCSTFPRPSSSEKPPSPSCLRARRPFAGLERHLDTMMTPNMRSLLVSQGLLRTTAQRRMYAVRCDAAPWGQRQLTAPVPPSKVVTRSGWLRLRESSTFWCTRVRDWPGDCGTFLWTATWVSLYH